VFANTFGGKFGLEIFLEHSWISSARLNSQIYKNYGQSSLPDEKFRLWHPLGCFHIFFKTNNVFLYPCKMLLYLQDIEFKNCRNFWVKSMVTLWQAFRCRTRSRSTWTRKWSFQCKTKSFNLDSATRCFYLCPIFKSTYQIFGVKNLSHES